jgi:hypothetical protein
LGSSLEGLPCKPARASSGFPQTMLDAQVSFCGQPVQNFKNRNTKNFSGVVSPTQTPIPNLPFSLVSKMQSVRGVEMEVQTQ